MKSTVIIATLLLIGSVFWVTGAFAQQRTRRSESRAKDVGFVNEAASGGKMEVELGKVAQDRGQSEGVKTFGRRMVDDHTRVNNELTQLAQQKGITIPDKMRPEHQQTINRLSRIPANSFDRAYMQTMVRDHRKDITAFQSEARRGKDPDVKKFAGTTLPTLQDHLKMAQDTLKNLPKAGTEPTTGTTTVPGATPTPGATPPTTTGVH